jgi:glycosyltransferase involved in cell wall biosynthesis
MIKKKIFYWSPFIDYVGTKISSKNSIISLSKFGKEEFSITVFNVVGEWNFYLEQLKKLNIEVINFGINKKIPFLKNKGFLFSRILYLKIFLLSFIPLLKILRNKKPDFFVISLITFVPLIINYLFRIKTTVILRISGFPKLTIVRSFFWKMMLTKVKWIFSPTNNTSNLLKEKFPTHKNKIKFIRDPIFSYEQFLKIKKKYNRKLKRKNFYLAVGRLTKQKNFQSLVLAVQKYNLKNKENMNVLVIGDGEEKKNLILLSKKLKVEKNIKFLGFRHNKFKYFFKAKALLCTSLWEDPGFIIIEAGISNLPVISNSCLSGPVEIIDDDKNGYLYKLNSVNSLVEKIQQFEEDKPEIILQKKINMKIYSRKYSISKFYKDFTKYV